MRQGRLFLLGQFPVRRLTREELTQIVVVIFLLDGICPFQSSGFGTQAVSTGLSIEMLEEP
jgi:hypothetical protein